MNTPMTHGSPCAQALSSMKPLPRKVANGGRSASPKAARVKTTPVTRR